MSFLISPALVSFIARRSFDLIIAATAFSSSGGAPLASSGAASSGFFCTHSTAAL